MTDSTACLPKELVEKYNIHVLPMLIKFKGRVYRDGIDLSPGQFYELLRRTKELPSTSAPYAEAFLEAFHQISQKVESIICITLSSTYSMGFSKAMKAKEMAREQLIKGPIEVIDGRTTGGALWFIVLTAARVAALGGSLGGDRDGK
jgi:DegV family protein with EDD domain